MLADNGRKPKIRRNYFITNDEIKILFKYSRVCGYKYQCLLALCAFRGLRISEALAVNMYDFSRDFSKLQIREAKTNKLRLVPLIEPLQLMIKDYCTLNVATFRNGFLFSTCNKESLPYLSCASAEAWFSKLRQTIGRKHPSFLEKIGMPRTFKRGKYRQKPELYFRYRIGFHSLRRWFETRLWSSTHNIWLIKEIMDYTDFGTLNSYINRSEIKERETEILDTAFSSLAQEMISNETDKNEKPPICQLPREPIIQS